MMLPDYAPVDVDELRARFEDAWGTSLDPRRGLTVRVDGERVGRARRLQPLTIQLPQPEAPEEEPAPEAPKGPSEIDLLTEIRDSLKK